MWFTNIFFSSVSCCYIFTGSFAELKFCNEVQFIDFFFFKKLFIYLFDYAVS